jgi:hypothetical protein
MKTFYVEQLLSALEESNPPAALMNKAVALVQQGAVTLAESGRNLLQGDVEADGEIYTAQVIVDERNAKFTINCECTAGTLCEHVVAVIYAGVVETLGVELGMVEAPAGGRKVQPTTPANRIASLDKLSAIRPWPSSRPADYEQDYRKLFDLINVKQMRDLAARRGIRLSGLRREVIIDQMAAGLAQADNLERTVAGLTLPARRALGVLKTLGEEGIQTQNANEARTTLTRALQAFPSEPGTSLKASKDGTKTLVTAALEELQASGLIFLDPYYYHVPSQVWELRDTNPTLFQPYDGPVERMDAAQACDFTRLALRTALLGQAGALKPDPPAQLDRGGWPAQIGKSSGGKEQPAPLESPVLTAESLYHAAGAAPDAQARLELAARLLRVGGFWVGGRMDNLSDEFATWLKMDSGDQSRALLSLALRLQSSWELNAAAKKHSFQMGQNTWGGDYFNFTAGLTFSRLRLFRLLAQAPAGQWLDISVLLKLLHGVQPYWGMEPIASRYTGDNLKQALEGLGTWIIEGRVRVDLLDFNAWEKTFGWFYRVLLTETFHWLGLVDVAWKSNRPVAFRISEFGEFLLGRRLNYSRPDSGDKSPATTLPVLKAASDNGLELNPDTADAEIVNLLLLAGRLRREKPGTDPKKNSAAEQKTAALSGLVFEISLEGLDGAFSGGWDAARIRELLEQGLRQPLPEGLRTCIDSAWEHYGRLHLYENIAIIEFADDYALPELMAATHLNQALLYTFSPRVIAVRPDRIDALVDELRARGYTPTLEGSNHAGNAR